MMVIMDDQVMGEIEVVGLRHPHPPSSPPPRVAPRSHRLAIDRRPFPLGNSTAWQSTLGGAVMRPATSPAIRAIILHRHHPTPLPLPLPLPSPTPSTLLHRRPSSSSSSQHLQLTHLDPSSQQPSDRSISNQLRSIFSPRPDHDNHQQPTLQQTSSIHQSPDHPHLHPDPPSLSFPFLRTSVLSNPSHTIHLDYLKQLSDSLNSNSYHRLSSLEFSHLLRHLQSDDLFKFLSPKSFEYLLDFNPSETENASIESTHYYVYHRIIFLLDRIYELKHLFNSSELDRFHSISLKRFAAVGLFTPAELVWDQMINPSSTATHLQPSTYDQILMIDCIRRASSNLHQHSHRVDRHRHLSRSHDQYLARHHQEPLSLTSSDLKRMINLTDSIARSLISSQSLDWMTERWAVRTVAEIFGLQGHLSRLSNWLKEHRSLDLEFPDHGTSWTDPKITAIVVSAFKDQNRLEDMIKIYEAARHPSTMMLTHHQSTKSAFESSGDDPQESIDKSNETIDRSTNPILTRTYHDLISACSKANRPHLALHYLTEAIERNEAYVRALPHHPVLESPSIPSLRLQPATYSDLIPNLVRKRRDTQLRSVLDLTNRLIRSTVEELDWIRSLVLNRSSKYPHESSMWENVLNSILPDLNGSHSHHHQDLEIRRIENTRLEKIVFTHDNQPRILEENGSKLLVEERSEDMINSETQIKVLNQLEKRIELDYLRILERTKFLTKSLNHSMRLVDRLNHLIQMTKLNRKLRFESNLLNQKDRDQKKKTNNLNNSNLREFFSPQPDSTYHSSSSSTSYHFQNHIHNTPNTTTTTNPTTSIHNRIQSLILQKMLLRKK